MTMIIHTHSVGRGGGGGRRRRRRRGFTLVELLMALMVTGVIMSAVVTLAWTLSTYHNDGEAALELATHGRFALAKLGRDVRTAQAACVSATGGLVLWMGDLDGNGQMQISEFVIYYGSSGDRTVRRLSYTAGPNYGAIGTASMTSVVNAFDAGGLRVTGAVAGLVAKNEVVCRNADGATFYANRAYPQTMTVECLLRLSRAENVVTDRGRTIALTLYDSGTMRVPYSGNGFSPQS